MKNEALNFRSTDFCYYEESPPKPTKGVTAVVVPLGFTTATEVFAFILGALVFGQPFIDHYSIGPNWDRINDLYLPDELEHLKRDHRSRHEKPNSRTALIHLGVPNLQDGVLEDDRVRIYYVGWLFDQIRDNDECDSVPLTHRLVVSFPESSREEIGRLVTTPLS